MRLSLIIGFFFTVQSLSCVKTDDSKSKTDTVRLIGKKISCIRIEHKGNQDKPIFMTVVCWQTCDSTFDASIVRIDSTLFTDYSAYVVEADTKVSRLQNYKYGVFKIVLKQYDGTELFYFLPSREVSIEYFSKMKNQFEGRDSNLSHALNTLLIRVKRTSAN